jgi:hypothetical protein
MRFHNSSADLFVPDGLDVPAALARTTHLAISAHQDDIEIMAYHGIAQCFGRCDRWFTGVVATNGAGSPCTGIYGGYTDAEMQNVRLIEQRRPRMAKPEFVYLHNLADKHDTHVAVVLRSIAALRAVRGEVHPKKVYGCEVWRDLDWLVDDGKQVLPASERSNIAAALGGVFDSQVSGGKRYDLATAGRRLAHATYYASHGTDEESALTFAMDLTSLVEDPDLPVLDYVGAFIDRFRADVERGVRAARGHPNTGTGRKHRAFDPLNPRGK